MCNICNICVKTKKEAEEYTYVFAYIKISPEGHTRKSQDLPIGGTGAWGQQQRDFCHIYTLSDLLRFEL